MCPVPKANYQNVVLSAVLVLAAAASSYFVLKARAGIAPGAQTLTYAGLLQDLDGNAVKGRIAIDFRLWDAREEGSEQCVVFNPRDNYDLGANGRFSVQLPEECVAAVRSQRELWVELRIAGEPLPRTQLGAVPYAVEAGRAVTADKASNADTADRAGGELAETIASLQSQITALQTPKPRFLVQNTKSKVPAGNVIVWSAVGIDSHSTFDAATGLYKIPIEGTYEFYFDLIMPNAPAGEYRYFLTKNGAPVHGTISSKSADTWQTTYSSFVMPCSVGDTIGVSFERGGGETYTDAYFNVFYGHML
jgi:hypothetical protein